MDHETQSASIQRNIVDDTPNPLAGCQNFGNSWAIRFRDKASQPPFGKLANVLHDLVITESGRSLGSIRDVIIVGGPSPRVVGFEVGGGSVGDGLVPLGAQSAVSGNALIVPDSFEQRIRTDLTGLAAELASIEESRS
jgi:hypothetical protein